MIKLSNLLFEDDVDQEEDLGKSHILSEKGYEFLKAKVDGLNKKASKWGVPPLELKLISEYFENKTVTDEFGDKKEVPVKRYKIELVGDPPRVEGYEFIAKVEHTHEGNILNYAPNASDKKLPVEYRTASQKCDVCHTNRERTNTFILKMLKDDPNRFPDKKTGDFIMVGSACLKRFLPNISANALIEYANMIEHIRNSITEAGEMDDDFMGGGGGFRANYIGSSTLGYWLSAAYLHYGKYISKAQANRHLDNSGSPINSSVGDAFAAMNSKVDQYEDEVHKRIREDDSFKQKVESFNKEFMDWVKSYDFNKLGEVKPEMADYFHNLSVLSKQDVIKIKNAGLFGGMFQTFIIDKKRKENRAQLAASKPTLSYIGQPGSKNKARVKVTRTKEYESQYGRGLIVNMEAKTTEKDPTTGQDVSKDALLLYFTGDSFELEEGEEADVQFTVKGHKENKYTGLPETQITRMKVLKFVSKPERNVGKEKIKDFEGTIKIESVREGQVFNRVTSQYDKEFFLYFSDSSGKRFYYKPKTEDEFNQLKSHDGKTAEAKWSLDRATTKDKFDVSDTYWPVSKLQITKVVS